MSEVIEHKEAVPGVRAALGLKEELSVIKHDFLALRKEFGEITYQLSTLYDRWTVEHQHVGKREAEMARSMEIFSKKMEGLGDKLQNTVKNAAAQTMTNVGETVGREVKKYFEHQIDSIAKRLESAVRNAEDAMQDYAKVKESTALKTVWIAVLISFLVGGAIGAAWVANNTISVDKFHKKVNR